MINGVKKLYEWLYGLLHAFDVTSYIDSLKDTLEDYIGWINWLIPFDRIATIYTAWLSCIGAYFIFIHIKPYIGKMIDRILKKGG